MYIFNPVECNHKDGSTGHKKLHNTGFDNLPEVQSHVKWLTSCRLYYHYKCVFYINSTKFKVQ